MLTSANAVCELHLATCYGGTTICAQVSTMGGAGG